MTFILIAEQILNGLQLGVTLFLMSAGLTLIFGVMGLINLAHGSLYMVGAFAAAAIAGATGSFILSLIAALTASAIAGTIVEISVLRRLYRRDHLDQVLADHQPHAYAFGVDLGRSLQFAKHFKQFFHVFFADTFASVYHVNL